MVPHKIVEELLSKLNSIDSSAKVMGSHSLQHFTGLKFKDSDCDIYLNSSTKIGVMEKMLEELNVKVIMVYSEQYFNLKEDKDINFIVKCEYENCDFDLIFLKENVQPLNYIEKFDFNIVKVYSFLKEGKLKSVATPYARHDLEKGIISVNLRLEEKGFIERAAFRVVKYKKRFPSSNFVEATVLSDLEIEFE